MTDYFEPTVIQPSIPAGDMTPLEKLLLSKIFKYEPDGDGVYFFAEGCPGGYLQMPAAELRAALAASAGVPSDFYDAFKDEPYIKDTLPTLADDEVAEFSLIRMELEWDGILQDIVRRSSTLRYITAVTSLTCSKMEPDSLGGVARVITADDVEICSTTRFLAEKTSMLDEAAAAPA